MSGAPGPEAGSSLEEIVELLDGLSDDDLADLVEGLPAGYVATLVSSLGGADEDVAASTLLEMAERIDEDFRVRPHLRYISDRLTRAVHDVEGGTSRRLVIEMPPRSGKTTLATMNFAAWILSRHPDWPIALTSHDGGLATSWGRQIRRWVEAGRLGGQVAIARDSGAASAWETTRKGKVLSISTRESFTGRGAKVIVVDDPHKDFVDAHSSTMRDNVWDWWLSVAQTRLEPPSLVVVIMTRWHEDDLVGRLLSTDYPGNPGDWEVIRLPAIAEEGDTLGRAVGEPLYSPLLDEDAEQALARWREVETSVGTYVWSAMYQQRPAPSKGSIFDMSAWRYWTSDPSRARDDGSVVYFNPADTPAEAVWVDSWDMSFKGGETSDFVVGQRWVRVGLERYLVAQQRGRWGFNEALVRVKAWGTHREGPGNPHGDRVWRHLIESTANGPAIIESLSKAVTGIKPVNPHASKEARARAITPEIESHHVLLPLPSDPGMSWVTDLLSEVRAFPYDAHDDQVDALTQALAELRDSGGSSVVVPGAAPRTISRRLPQSSRSFGQRLSI